MEIRNPTNAVGKNIFSGENSIVNLTINIIVLKPSESFTELLPNRLFMVMGTYFTLSPSL